MSTEKTYTLKEIEARLKEAWEEEYPSLDTTGWYASPSKRIFDNAFKPEPWKPKEGESYWGIYHNGIKWVSIEDGFFLDYEHDREMLQCGNYFQTDDLAKMFIADHLEPVDFSEAIRTEEKQEEAR